MIDLSSESSEVKSDRNEDFPFKKHEFTKKEKYKRNRSRLPRETIASYMLLIVFNNRIVQEFMHETIKGAFLAQLSACIFLKVVLTIPYTLACLYLGKYLRNGSLSLFNCCPLLAGVGIFSYLLSVINAGFISFMPMFEHLVWRLIVHRMKLPTCKEQGGEQCVEYYGTAQALRCCPLNGSQVDCVDELKYPVAYEFDTLIKYCDSPYFFTSNCYSWIAIFVISQLFWMRPNLTHLGWHVRLANKLLTVIEVIEIWQRLPYFETATLSLEYFFLHRSEFFWVLRKIFRMLVFEVEILAMCTPWYLLLGRLMHPDIKVLPLVILVNLRFVGKVISGMIMSSFAYGTLASVERVPLECIVNSYRSNRLYGCVRTQLFMYRINSTLGYIAALGYLFVHLFHKTNVLAVLSVLLAYELCDYWYGIESPQKRSILAEFLHKSFLYLFKTEANIFYVIKSIILLFVCYSNGVFNCDFLNSISINSVMPNAIRSVMLLQIFIFSACVFWLYSVRRLVIESEYVLHTPVPSMVSRLWTGIPLVVLITGTCYTYLHFNGVFDISLAWMDVKENMNIYYSTLVVYALFIVVVYVWSAGAYFVHYRVVPLVRSTEAWAPVDRKGIGKFEVLKTGRSLSFYDVFSQESHRCHLKNQNIKEASRQAIDNVERFMERWYKVFETDKYSKCRPEVHAFLSEAYMDGVLVGATKPPVYPRQ